MGSNEQQKKGRFDKIFANTFRGLLLIAIVGNILTASWLSLFTASTALLLTFLPFMIARKNHIYLPQRFQTLILIFIFASLYLGSLGDFYNRFWWWDLMLHTLSGVILGLIGFLLTYVLNNEAKVNVKMSPFFVAFFSFSFAVTMGVMWEIYEFSVDTIFGLNMQRGSLENTMWDLIVDTAGAIFSCTIGYFYLKGKKFTFIDKFIKSFSKSYRFKKK